jgi:hypothetical protein
MEQKEKMEELTIKFAKGLAEPFTSKDGKELMRIKIPNIDPNDHSPWMSFVLPAKAVHENQYGKGLWAKIPAEGSTTVSQSVKRGEEDGKAIWDRVDTVLSNKQLKGLVEAYKGKEERGADTASQKRSVLNDLKEKKKEVATMGWTKADEDALPFR